MTQKSTYAVIVFHGRFPSEKAAALFVAEHAKALIKHMHVRILVPNRKATRSLDAQEMYQMPEGIEVVRLPTLDLFGVRHLGPIPFFLSSFVFSLFVARYLFRIGDRAPCVFANDLIPGLAAVCTSRNVIYEVHDYPEHWRAIYAFMFRRVRLIIATNRWKEQALTHDFHSIRTPILMERNGVDLTLFKSCEKFDARNHLNLSQTSKIVVYTGHLYSWKGVDVLIKAASSLPDLLFFLVGGTPEDVSSYSTTYAEYRNVFFSGHVSHSEIPYWQAAADVLVLPNTAQEEISARYTSPMKLFEYMASNRPIVASRLPSITEVINDSSAFLCEPDNPQAFATAIQAAITNTEESARRAANARRAVDDHAWDARTMRILRALNSI